MKRNILLVEDDAFLQELYSELLTKEGYTVTVIDNGTEAEKAISDKKWDLVLLDIILPGMDGFQILDSVKEKKIKISFPIIYLTNLDGSRDDIQKLKKAKDYWIKSDMDPPEFVKRVNNIFA